jgi:alpha-1,2-mannosyltransferase
VLWAGVVLAVAHDLWVIPHRPPGDRLADLHVYVGSVRSLLDGGSLYDFHAAGTGAPFTYPPFAGLVLLPVGFVPEPALRVWWTLATLLVAAVLVWCFVPRSAGPGLPLAALGLACSAPFISNLRFGQVSIVVVLLALVDCLDLPPPRWRGVALGLAAAIKLTPLVFVPYLWFSGRRRAAVTSLLVFAAALGLTALVLPADTWRWARHEAWHTDRIGDLAQLGNQSVNGALLRWGVPYHGVVLAVVCAVVLVVAYRRARRVDPLAGFVIVGAAGLAVSPVSWTHHQFVLYLAAIPLVLSGHRIAVVSGVLVAALMIVPLDLLARVPGLASSRAVLAVCLAVLPVLSASWWSRVPTLIDDGRSSPVGRSVDGTQ